MNVCKKIYDMLTSTGRVFMNEFRVVFGDMGVILFFVLLPLMYPVIYTLIYNTELVRRIPVAVVDHSMTAASREFIRKASASPSIEIYANVPEMNEARSLMAEHKVYGIIEIPGSYSRDIGMGIQTHVQFYSDMSLLLRYRALMSAMTDLQMELATDITRERISMSGAASSGGLSSLPINSESNFLGDTEQGFASFVIPGIVVLVLQQSMILGICLMGGTSRERRRRNGGIDPEMVQGVPAAATVWGRTLCYVLIYSAFTIYALHIVPWLFNLPQSGRASDYLVFIFPMLLATSFLGQTLNIFMKERESSFLIIVVTSVLFMFLSGLTWPRYAMHKVWILLGDCLPSTWGIEGFIRINSNGATLADNTGSYTALWILTAVYMLLSIAVTKYIDKKSHQQYEQSSH